MILTASLICEGSPRDVFVFGQNGLSFEAPKFIVSQYLSTDPKPNWNIIETLVDDLSDGFYDIWAIGMQVKNIPRTPLTAPPTYL
jgi:hypothetical protein